MTVRAELAGKYPGTFLLDPNDLPGIVRYLRRREWIGSREIICGVEPAGEGNMNCTLRIQTSERTFILKQARPWVEKYPHIAAPWDRAEMEARFYQTVITHSQIAQHMPKLLGFDLLERVLMLEDLGLAQDFTFLYRNQESSLEAADFGVLTHYLVALHRSFRDCQFAEDFSNSKMRALNHEHIFVFPLRAGNGLDLDSITPGLGALARHLRQGAPGVLSMHYVGFHTVVGESYIQNAAPAD
jgi:5-methylthioribose kinase